MKNNIAKKIGAGFIGAVALANVSNAEPERLQVDYIFNQGVTLKMIYHSVGEEGDEGRDKSYPGPGPVSVNPYPAIITSPYGVDLDIDYRPEDSRTLVNAVLSAGNRSNVSETTSNHSLHFEFFENNIFHGADTNRNHLAKIELSSPYLSGGNTNFFINIDEVASPDLADQIELPALSAFPSLSTNIIGTAKFSRDLKVQELETGKDLPVTNDLSRYQLSGLEYRIESALNGSASVVDGTNLVYNPNAGFFGDGNAVVGLYGNVGEKLAEVRYDIGVTNRVTNQSPVAGVMNMNALAGKEIVRGLEGSDGDGDALIYGIVVGPSNGVANVVGSNLVYTANSEGGDFMKYFVSDGQASDTNDINVSVWARQFPHITRFDKSADGGRIEARVQEGTMNRVFGSDRVDGVYSNLSNVFGVAFEPNNGYNMRDAVYTNVVNGDLDKRFYKVESE